MPEKLEESDWAKISAIVGGAGASAMVASQVQKAVPQVGAEMAGAGAGVVMFLYGDRLNRLVKWAGIGIIAGSLMPRVAEWFKGFGEKKTETPPSSSSSSSSNAATQMAQAYAASAR